MQFSESQGHPIQGNQEPLLHNTRFHQSNSPTFTPAIRHRKADSAIQHHPAIHVIHRSHE
jgi:hypothetical protein